MVSESLSEPLAGASAKFANPDVTHPLEDVAATVIKLLQEADRFIDGNRIAAKACINRASALIELASEGRGGIDRGDDAAKSPTLLPWQAKRVAEYVTNNLASPIRVHDLAAVVGLSTSYFSRAFKGCYGMTGLVYVAKRRMQFAQELMLTTDEPLSQIALACGLSDQPHFCRLFRREVGLPPAVWRRDRRGRIGRTVVTSLPPT